MLLQEENRLPLFAYLPSLFLCSEEEEEEDKEEETEKEEKEKDEVVLV